MNNYLKLIYLLEKMKGKNFQYIGRCLDLVWIGFGDLIERKTEHGVDRIAEYSLHIQCPFKIMDKCKIVVGKGDMFVSATDIEDAVDLSLQNNTLFDLKAKTLMDSFKKEKIIDVKLKEWGDLKIYLESINKQYLLIILMMRKRGACFELTMMMNMWWLMEQVLKFANNLILLCRYLRYTYLSA